jgi:hypothetical protein
VLCQPRPPKGGGDTRTPRRLGWYTEYNAFGHSDALRDGRPCWGLARVSYVDQASINHGLSSVQGQCSLCAAAARKGF